MNRPPSDPRIELALQRALARAIPERSPPYLGLALRHALFPGGARLRPRLVLVAARANGDADPRLADRAAAAVELLHSASLVHDDLPCFDDAPTRRGHPSVHRRFGEATAVLVGDQLIVQSFSEIARCPRMIAIVARAARALVAGQALEAGGAGVDVARYHRAKTSSLFAAAASLGALAARADPAPWRAFGLAIGQAYQAADDVADAVGSARSLGKPVRRDDALQRPSLVVEVGLPGAGVRLATLLDVAAGRAPTALAREFVDRLRATATLGTAMQPPRARAQHP